MSRFDEFTRTAPEQESEAFHTLRRWLDGGPFERTEGPFKAYLHRPEIGNGFLEIDRRPRENAALSMRLRELIILVTAHLGRCEFEWFAHDALALKSGLDDGVAAALAESRKPKLARPDEAAIYDFCIELDETRSVSDETFDRARRRGRSRTPRGHPHLRPLWDDRDAETIARDERVGQGPALSDHRRRVGARPTAPLRDLWLRAIEVAA